MAPPASPAVQQRTQPHPTPPARAGITKEEKKVILASSLGTVFEWYDFYLYGSLAAIISKQFFGALNETSAFIFALLAFAAGFAVRPFGAIVFGRLGDLIGRKYTFLVTILIMGGSTAIVGMLPSYATIGILAPIILIAMRMLQGLALGGEYGGAATYVAEHAPDGKRGAFTSWIQTTATVGLFLSLLVILGCRLALGPAFDVWGWRIPFLLSIVLLAVSVYIRMQLNESPVFKRMKEEGKASKAPLTESFLRWGNLKIVLLVLFGGVAGQAVVWYTGMFYELFFLLQALKLDPQIANMLVAGSLILATPFFIVFGSLSDRIGRKKIIMAGCLIAALTYFPIFKALTKYANPAIFAAQASNPVTVVANEADCSFQFDPIGKRKFTSSCDLAKSWLARKAIPYGNEAAPAGAVASVKIGQTVIASFPGNQLPADEFKAKMAEFDKVMGEAVKAAGYPAKADMSQVNYPMVVLLLFILALYVTMVYAPMAAWLVEMFPARIRYTSMSLPYHIGNGWFGGFLPTIAFAMVAATGDIYYGLWYPIVIAVMTFVIGSLFMPETHKRNLEHH
ncbi:MFS transporter [Anaeromyxobacter sp. Fw109-5]|uniref:MFS transporter n=1 Tax=Anaeromyxobacter sp. (strain Fw109-5) TaxID=404589 RepID=UPI0000ED8ADC|nr:MFS transporter [Anaeromyxobacter sp. Fw109-5]ABS27536.1 major facilitator superfamily MFS_1 [Anaeromyxobacter sp. Fw109-5]